MFARLQIICARLKLLAMPPGRALVQPFDAPLGEGAEDLAPHILTGTWNVDARQRRLLPRLRYPRPSRAWHSLHDMLALPPGMHVCSASITPLTFCHAAG